MGHKLQALFSFTALSPVLRIMFSLEYVLNKYLLNVEFLFYLRFSAEKKLDTPWVIPK